MPATSRRRPSRRAICYASSCGTTPKVAVAGDTAGFPRPENTLDEVPRLELTIGDGQDSPCGHDRAHRLISAARYAAGSGHPTIARVCVRAPLGTVRRLRHFLL